MYQLPPSSLCFLHPASWIATVMAGILIAILDHEVKMLDQ